MTKTHIFLFIVAGCIVSLIFPAQTFATQGHIDPEGLYVHQLSHLFFVISMGIIIYGLRFRKLIHKKGWQYIQYAALLFIMWTLDAFFVHLLDEQMKWVQVSRIDPWHIRIESVSPILSYFYSMIKLDHLLCVPAMIFLYLGLKELSKDSNVSPSAVESTGDQGSET